MHICAEKNYTEQQNLENKNRKKNKFMDTSGERLEKLRPR